MNQVNNSDNENVFPDDKSLRNLTAQIHFRVHRLLKSKSSFYPAYSKFAVPTALTVSTLNAPIWPPSWMITTIQMYFQTTNISTVFSPGYSHKRKISKATPGPVQDTNTTSFSSRNFKEMYVNPKHAETREQSETSSFWSFFTVVDQPIQHFTSGILSLCLLDSETTIQVNWL